MTTVRVDIAPNLLRWAVKRAHWDEETVRKRAPKLDAWIDGTTRPTLKQVEKFAAATHASFGMLFLPEPPVEDIPIPDMRRRVQRVCATTVSGGVLCGWMSSVRVLHVSWTVTKNRFNRTREVKSVLCPHQSTAKSSNSRSCRVVAEKPLHDQLGGKILRSGPANRGKLGEQVEENPFRHRG